MMESTTLIVSSAGRGVRIARSEGDEWFVATTLSREDVRCLAVHPLNSAHLFAGTQGNGLFESTDGGGSWSHIGLEGIIVKSVAVAPDAIYAGTKPARVYVSSDGGQHWREQESFRHIPGRRLWWSPAEAPGTAYVQSLAVSPSDPKVVLAGIELGAVVRSHDGGVTWSRHIKGTLRDCHTMKFHASDGTWAYEAGGTGGGASVSMDGGVTWAKVKQGLNRHYGVACAADPEEPDVWYVSVSPGPGKAHSLANAEAYIFRSRSGEPWIKLEGGLPQPLDSMPYGLATIPDRPGLVIGALKNGQVWASDDHGDTWNRLLVDLGPIRLGLLALEV